MSTIPAAIPGPFDAGTPPPSRLGMALLVAAALHGALILGVGFSLEPDSAARQQTLDVVLVPTRSERAPEEADFLAQANQEGGGESVEPERPSTPVPAPLTANEAVVPAAAPPAAPPPPAVREPQAPRPVLTREAAAEQAPAPRPEPVPAEAPPAPTAEAPPQPAPPAISAAELVTRSLEMATLNAQIEDKLRAYAERPRRKFINARTREYKYAAYMEAWRAKVERVGNLNYPDQARRESLSGSLLLDVALRADGGIEAVNLRRSSGYKVLDDAAIAIVRLAAPYAPFPEDIREETDILHIERTWQFLGSNRLFAR